MPARHKSFDRGMTFKKHTDEINTKAPPPKKKQTERHPLPHLHHLRTLLGGHTHTQPGSLTMQNHPQTIDHTKHCSLNR